MIFKILGSMIIFCSCMMIGYIFANQREQRVSELKLFISALNMLAIEIKFAVSLLPNIMFKISDNIGGIVGKVFKVTADNIVNNNMTAGDGFRQALESLCSGLNISKEDKSVLLQLTNSLGEVDSESQLKSIDMVIEQLKIQEEFAQNERIKTVKMYKSLGVVIGIAIVILFV